MDNKIKKIFKGSPIVINKNHDEAFKFFLKFKKQISETEVLVNFDTHSDIIVNIKNEKLNIANWVNYCIKNLNIKKVYWVLPNYITDIEANRVFFEKRNPKKQSKNFIGHKNIKLKPLKNNINNFFYLYNTDELLEESHINKISKRLENFNLDKNILEKINYKKIEIIIITMNSLEELKNNKVLLSVDADFFCNSGYDTLKCMNNKNISKGQLNLNFNEFVDKLYLNRIVPLCTSLTYSPIYFPKKYEQEIIAFYSKIYHAND